MIEQQRLSNQQRVCLHALREARGSWVNGGYFLKELGYSQFHARLKELRDLKGYKIETEKIKRNGYYSYRLVENTMPPAFKPKVDAYEERTKQLLGF